MRGMTQVEMRGKYLDLETEIELAIGWRDRRDQTCLDRLVNAHDRLAKRAVWAICKSRDHPSFDDLMQEARVGLLMAAKRFDPDLGNRFSTYAQWWIKAQLQDNLLKNWSLVRGGSSAAQKRAYFAVRRLSITANISDVRPEKELLEISEGIGIPLHDVNNLYDRVTWGDFSLNTPIKSHDNSQSMEHQDTLIDPAPLAEEVVLDKLQQERARSLIELAMKDLNDRERYIFKRRRLWEESLTLQQLSEEFNVTKERIRQIEVRALEKFTAEIKRLMSARREEYA